MVEQKIMDDSAKRLTLETKGPISTFVPLRKEEIRHLLSIGESLPRGLFSHCALFDDSDESVEQKRGRYELKRLKEIQLILSRAQSDEQDGYTCLDYRMNEMLFEQKLHEVSLVEACRKWNQEAVEGTLSERNWRLYSESIDAAQDALYPRYKQPIAKSSINKVLTAIDTKNPDVRGILTDKYPFMQFAEAEGMPELGTDKREAWSAALHEKYDPVIKAVQDEMAAEGHELTNNTLPYAGKLFIKHIGMPLRSSQSDGWDVIADPSRSGWVNDPGTKTAYVGTRSTEIDWTGFGRLMVHEMYHCIRAENGSRTGYEGLQIGMPGSGEGEEGMALLLEALWSGKNPDSLGRDDFRYLAVTYAEGDLDGRQHTEDEVYHFIDEIMAASGLARYSAVDGVNAGALDHVTRAYRGMPEGKILRSNMAYRSGKVRAMEQLANTERDPIDELAALQCGKYNASSREQCQIVDEIWRSL